MGDHAILSPSAAERWMACPGSVAASAGLPDRDSPDSLYGTYCHEVAALALNEGKDADAYLGYISDELKTLSFRLTKEDAAFVQVYLDYVRQRRDELQARLMVEVRVYVNKDMNGTGDAILVAPAKGLLEVIDLKMGAGHFVDVRNNKQLTIYGIGAYGALPFDEQQQINEVHLTIVQPRRTDENGNAVRTTSMTKIAMIAAKVNIEAAGREAMKPDAPRSAGKHCTFCKAAPSCDALRNQSLAVAQLVFSPEEGLQNDPAVSTSSELRLPAVEQLTADQLGMVLDKIHLLEDWIAQIHKSAEARARVEKIPGRKLVEKIGHRKWKDADTAARILTERGVDPYEKSLISPAAAEKLIGKGKKSKFLDELTERPVTGVVLVDDADPRPPFNVASVFLGNLLD